MRSIIKMMLRVTAATFLVMTIVPCAPAQSTNGDEERSECGSALGLERERCESEMAEIETGEIIPDALGRPTQSEEFRLPLAQISEDLSFLRTVTNYLSDAASQSGELDLKAIAESASRIRKRADRLKDSLALPDPEKSAKYREGKVPTDTEQLRAALLALSSLISDAVRNPVLRGHLLDITRSVKARGELDEIVELSERVKMSCEILGQTGH